jgi:hypothetical protein
MTRREVANEDENEYSDPDTAAEQVPRVLFGCSAHSRQKRARMGPESAAKLRTSRDGDSQGGIFRESAEEKDRVIGERSKISLDDLSIPARAVRRYGEGGATGPPKD